MGYWDNISGQDSLISYFKSAAAGKKISHAYILEGETGAPAREMASGFSRMLMCETRDGCGTCSSCRAFDSGNHPDVIWVKHEKPDTIRIDEIREQLIDDIGIRPYRSEYKAYLVDEAEKMNAAAQNALLKTLEEPPSYGIIILITSNAETLLPTILSRCTRLTVNNTDRGIRSLREEDREAVISVLRSVGNNTVSANASAAASWKEREIPTAVIFHLIRSWFRDILICKSIENNPPLILQKESEYIRRAAGRYSFRQCNDILMLTDRTEKRIASNVDFELAVGLLLSGMRVSSTD